MRHRVAAFMCTDDELSEWLRYKAAEQQHVERCFVVCSQGHDEVDAFYTLTGHRLVREATDATEGQTTCPHRRVGWRSAGASNTRGWALSCSSTR